MPGRSRRSREPWPVALAAALSFMIGTSFGFYRVASQHPDPLVVADAYSAGRAYSDRVRAERRADALGWQVALSAQPHDGRAAVHVTVHDGARRPVPVDRVTLVRERPAEGGFDRTVPLTAGPNGWDGTVTFPLPGRWVLVVHAERGDDVAERSFAVWNP
jgi:nitrogen fixation protein FixH